MLYQRAAGHQLPAGRERSHARFEQAIPARMTNHSRINFQRYRRIHRVQERRKSTAAIPSCVPSSSSRCQELLNVSLLVAGKGQKRLAQPVAES